MRTSTPALTPLTWLKFVTVGSERMVRHGLYSLNATNFETVELLDYDYEYNRRMTTLRNNVFHSKIDQLTGESYPAIMWDHGSREWLLNGQGHRDHVKGIDLPAWIGNLGSQVWYIRGNHHRDPIDGISQPASVMSYGVLEWWINGKGQRDSIDGVDKSDTKSVGY